MYIAVVGIILMYGVVVWWIETKAQKIQHQHTSRRRLDRRTSGDSKYLHFFADASMVNDKVDFEQHCKVLKLNIAHRPPDTCGVYQAEVVIIYTDT